MFQWLLLLLLIPGQVRDLRSEWKVYVNETYQPAGVRPEELTIYFDISADRYRGQYLRIEDQRPWEMFINGRLISSGSTGEFSLDSLAALYSSRLFVGIYSRSGRDELKTSIVARNAVSLPSAPAATERPPGFFRNYAILAAAILILFFIALLKTNPQLTLDYFTFSKIFSVQERNERLITSRIGSSVNLLFYLFCALLTGFLLSVIFQVAGPAFVVSKSLVAYSLGQAFALWLELSLFILLLLAAKLIIVLAFSSLFNFRDTITFQFFNFLRFILFTSTTLAALSLGYFMLGGSSPAFYEALVILSLLLLSLGSVMVLIKLLARAPFTFFHLFSYLCASEIIPLVVIIKIFF